SCITRSSSRIRSSFRSISSRRRRISESLSPHRFWLGPFGSLSGRSGRRRCLLPLHARAECPLGRFDPVWGFVTHRQTFVLRCQQFCEWSERRLLRAAFSPLEDF